MKDLDEYSTDELEQELKRRHLLTDAGKCDYCGRLVAEPSCRFAERHRPSSKGRHFAMKAEIKAARDLYKNDDCEIDDPAQVSETDHGVWVQAWVWLAEGES